MDKQLELSTELRKARNWILGVGLVMFGYDMYLLYVSLGDRLPADVQHRWTLYCGLVLAYFVGLYVLAKSKPVLAAVLALIGFWAVQLYQIIQDPTMIVQGIPMKLLFTFVLIRGIKSANRAEQLQKELAQVFG